ncbi:hypothetical protein H4R18_003745, partial [Coemansia javaensis]
MPAGASASVLDLWPVQTCQTAETATTTSICSDHDGLECIIRVPRADVELAERRLRTGRLLEDADARALYEQALEQAMAEWTNAAKRVLDLDPTAMTQDQATEHVSKLNDDFCGILRKALEKVVGRAGPPILRRAPWWSKSLAMAKTRSIAAYRRLLADKWSTSPDPGAIRASEAAHVRAKRELADECKRAALAYW